ncbi:hypothetical protein Fmac_032716 [Flemingia macrophylla]|uniref:F-box domain-containing protein n=1 Tax=Flemingia macrophylla TaxID=520843 RepID=A0ABD1L5Q4_9FABA
MDELVPEITTHALSYLDYPSLCHLSMTNSSMRKAANDDNAWKALYHKDFTLEQDSVTPTNGWKAYYAATRAIVNINTEFFNIVRDKSLPSMSRFWLNADYVKCIHASGELFSGLHYLKEVLLFPALTRGNIKVIGGLSCLLSEIGQAAPSLIVEASVEALALTDGLLRHYREVAPRYQQYTNTSFVYFKESNKEKRVSLTLLILSRRFFFSQNLEEISQGDSRRFQEGIQSHSFFNPGFNVTSLSNVLSTLNQRGGGKGHVWQTVGEFGD